MFRGTVFGGTVFGGTVFGGTVFGGTVFGGTVLGGHIDLQVIARQVRAYSQKDARERTSVTGSGVPPRLRADAARNADRILVAASGAFAESGADVSMGEIARRAQVGVATLYRHFPTKDELVRACFDRVFHEQLQPSLAQALTAPDSWLGLTAALESVLEVAARYRELVTAARQPWPVLEALRAPAYEALGRVLQRARDEGRVRADLDVADLPQLVAMVMATMTAADGAAPDAAWRRYLAMLLDGLALDAD